MAEAATKEYDFGKDHVVLMTDADATIGSKYQLPERDIDDNEPRGVIQPNGDFNWECPCLGGMATGPCGLEFREAFSCVQLSKEEPKGMECMEAFKSMQECMNRYPSLYDRGGDDDDDDEDNIDNLVDADVNTADSQERRLETKLDESESKGAASETASPSSSPVPSPK